MRVVVASVTVLAAVFATPAFAQESSREEFKAFCEMLRGRWVGDVTWVADWPGFGKRGEKVTAYWTAQLTEDGNLLVGKFLGGDGSESSIIYYHPGKKQIIWTMVSTPIF